MQAINETLAFDMLKNQSSLFEIVTEKINTSQYNVMKRINKVRVVGLFYTEVEDSRVLTISLENGSNYRIDNLGALYPYQNEALNALLSEANEKKYSVFTDVNSSDNVIVLGRETEAEAEEYVLTENLLK